MMYRANITYVPEDVINQTITEKYYIVSDQKCKYIEIGNEKAALILEQINNQLQKLWFEK